MTWDTVFLLVNYWAFAGWIALVFLPRGPKILAAILYAGVFLLGLADTVISLRILVKVLPRLASRAPFLCLIVCHFE